MLPRWHIFWGAIFSLLLYILFPQISLLNIIIVFLSSFLIDFDHYAASISKTRSLSLFKSFEYYKNEGCIFQDEKKKGIRRRGTFHPFHTLEFHALILIIGLFFNPFIYIFIGMLFHSFLDLIYMVYNDVLYLREFLFFNWLLKKF